MSEKNYMFGNFEKEQMLEVLLKADADPLLAGFVYPHDETRKRLPIYNENKLIGFATPRQDKDEVWRMGAIYILPEFRNMGFAKKIIKSFMANRRGRAFIENDNIASQKAYSASSFNAVREDLANDGWWWENF
ncbi:GNAT family N-acetyltransferase [Bacteriovorax sp. PP10]|uniref:GNAT family N-acetyltransferase n=1 Tax=Bacteriovorax antarcticus TaxID=3088717 RepID=A0ABU5VVD3_9BACT|nr:GNAT family N-acetyltransferase [Bacteriovorax sp. PP10]MEA9357004.1 GNAT family N-acetyltransferase [Bacteriovorax sp. PP10]